MTESNSNTERPTGELRWTIEGVLEQRWEINDAYQHTWVWRSVPRPMYNGLVLYPAYFYD